MSCTNKLTPKMAVVGALAVAAQAAHGQNMTLQGIGTFFEVATDTTGTVPITDWGVIADPPNVSYPYLEMREYFVEGGSFDQRVYIRVDLSSIPAGSAVTGAQLGLGFFDSNFSDPNTPTHSDNVDLWSVADEFTNSPTNTTYDGTNPWTESNPTNPLQGNIQAGITGYHRTGPTGRHLASLYKEGTPPAGTPSNLIMDNVQEYKHMFDHDRGISKFEMDALDEYLTKQVLAGKDAYFQLSIDNGDGLWQRFVSTSDDGTFWYGQTGNPAFFNQPKLELTASTFVPTWHLNDAGNWSAPAGNWYADVVPNGVGQTAKFGGYTQGSVTVNVDSPKTVGHLIFDSAEVYTIGGTNAVTLDVATGSASVDVNTGAHLITAPVNLAKDTTVTVTAGNQLSVLGAVTPSAGVNLTKQGAGELVVNHLRVPGVIINQGTITVLADGGNSGVSYVDNLSIAGAGALDLTDNDLVVNNGNFSDIQGLVLAGFGNPTAITSSTSDGTQILALFDNAQVGAGDWAGQPIGANAVVGKYTYFGDVNIDGQVTGDDYTIIDSNLDTDPAVGIEWLSGDANLDGIVTGDDYTIIDSNLELGEGSPLTPSAIAVPEPAGVAVLITGALLGMGRRRRRALWLAK